MLQIRLHAIIWSYGLAQAGEEDLSPFTVSKRNAAVIKNLEELTHFEELS